MVMSILGGVWERQVEIPLLPWSFTSLSNSWELLLNNIILWYYKSGNPDLGPEVLSSSFLIPFFPHTQFLF